MHKETLLKESTFNFKNTDEKGKLGFRWNDSIKLSYKTKCANDSVKELFNMINVTKYYINISIKLNTKKEIHLEL